MMIVSGDKDAVAVYVADPASASALQVALHAITPARMTAPPPCVNGQVDALFAHCALEV
jgi:hypothetical protein